VQYVYVGDIGDNRAIRSSIKVHRVLEPSVSAFQAPATVTLSGFATLTFVYPDGPRDAESMFVDPLTRDLYFISKRENPHRVYRAGYPQSTSGTTTLEYMTEFTDAAWLTAADISPDGNEILVRGAGSTTGKMFSRPSGGSIADAFNTTPVTVPLRTEPQGEAIAFDRNGWGYYTVSEGTSQPIYYFDRVLDGDYNQNDMVDAADYTLWRNNSGPPSAYTTWRGNFAKSPPASAFWTAVPEPGVGLLIWIALAIALWRIRGARSIKWPGRNLPALSRASI
jgi:hypothetical protein